MENVYLHEAFKALDILNEEDFNLSYTDDVRKLSDFIEEDDTESLLDIIDPDATTEEELKDDYIGKIIVDCEVCHSKFYKDPSDVVIDEETQLVNIDEECPFCYSTEGYKIIGQVAPYQEVEEEEIEVDIEDDIEDEVEAESQLEEDYLTTTQLKSPKRYVYEICDKAGIEPPLFPDSVVGGYRIRYRHRSKEDAERAIEELKRAAKELNIPVKKALTKQIRNDWYSYVVVPRYEIEVEQEVKEGFPLALAGAAASKVLGDVLTQKECVEGCAKSKSRKRVKEHFEKVEVETASDKVEVSSEDDKIVVTTEPKEEILEPIDAETKVEIIADSETSNDEIEEIESEEEQVVEEESEDEFVDVDIKDFSEEEFNELGESYLKRVYENVQSFKTSSARIKNNQLVVEGIIGFNSGKQKKTSFIFEGKDMTKRGKYRLIGENLQMSRGRKSFTLQGSLDNGRFISESLNYNYRTKDANGNSKRLYGTVKVK